MDFPLGRTWDRGAALIEPADTHAYAAATTDVQDAWYGPDAITPPMFHVRLMRDLLFDVMEDKVLGLDMLKLLLDNGADVESPNNEGQTALMAVARTGNVAAATLLVKEGADVNAAEGWGGQTALMWAAARKHPQMIDFLIGKGAEVDKRAIDRNWERRVTSEPRVKEMQMGGFTALLYAVRENCLGCVKRLLDAGADINKPDPDNISPLVLALLKQTVMTLIFIRRRDDARPSFPSPADPFSCAGNSPALPMDGRR
jgi:ankyrin repeat protein